MVIRQTARSVPYRFLPSYPYLPLSLSVLTFPWVVWVDRAQPISRPPIASVPTSLYDSVPFPYNASNTTTNLNGRRSTHFRTSTGRFTTLSSNPPIHKQRERLRETNRPPEMWPSPKSTTSSGASGEEEDVPMSPTTFSAPSYHIKQFPFV